MEVDRVMRWLRSYRRRPWNCLRRRDARQALFVETGTYLSEDHWATVADDLQKGSQC